MKRLIRTRTGRTHHYIEEHEEGDLVFLFCGRQVRLRDCHIEDEQSVRGFRVCKVCKASKRANP